MIKKKCYKGKRYVCCCIQPVFGGLNCIDSLRIDLIFMRNKEMSHFNIFFLLNITFKFVVPGLKQNKIANISKEVEVFTQ